MAGYSYQTQYPQTQQYHQHITANNVRVYAGPPTYYGQAHPSGYRLPAQTLPGNDFPGYRAPYGQHGPFPVFRNAPTIQQPLHHAAAPAVTGPANIEAPPVKKRGGGRPKGSKNKPKDPNPPPKRKVGRPPGAKNKKTLAAEAAAALADPHNSASSNDDAPHPKLTPPSSSPSPDHEPPPLDPYDPTLDFSHGNAEEEYRLACEDEAIPDADIDPALGQDLSTPASDIGIGPSNANISHASSIPAATLPSNNGIGPSTANFSHAFGNTAPILPPSHVAAPFIANANPGPGFPPATVHMSDVNNPDSTTYPPPPPELADMQLQILLRGRRLPASGKRRRDVDRDGDMNMDR